MSKLISLSNKLSEISRAQTRKRVLFSVKCAKIVKNFDSHWHVAPTNEEIVKRRKRKKDYLIIYTYLAYNITIKRTTNVAEICDDCLRGRGRICRSGFSVKRTQRQIFDTSRDFSRSFCTTKPRNFGVSHTFFVHLGCKSAFGLNVKILYLRHGSYLSSIAGKKHFVSGNDSCFTCNIRKTKAMAAQNPLFVLRCC